MKKLSKKEQEEFAEFVDEFEKINKITFSEFLDEIIETKKRQKQEEILNFSNSKDNSKPLPLVETNFEEMEREREEYFKYVDAIGNGFKGSFDEFLGKSEDIENFSELTNRIKTANFSLNWDTWRKEQLQQIEELEKNLPEFKKDK